MYAVATVVVALGASGPDIRIHSHLCLFCSFRFSSSSLAYMIDCVLILSAHIFSALTVRTAVTFVTETAVTLNVVDAPAMNAAVTDTVVKVILTSAAIESRRANASVMSSTAIEIYLCTNAVSAVGFPWHAVTGMWHAVWVKPIIQADVAVITVDANCAILAWIRGAFVYVFQWHTGMTPLMGHRLADVTCITRIVRVAVIDKLAHSTIYVHKGTRIIVIHTIV